MKIHIKRLGRDNFVVDAPSLREADLYGADLRWANFREAKLREANLYGANLRGADLRRADLRWANLEEANLEGADLRRADLRGTDLRGADLRWANLEGANLHGADLPGANLRWAMLHGADFRWADLGEADLCWAKLRGADLRWAKLPHFQLPDGVLTVWKVVAGSIVCLSIPAEARRTATPIGRKCRAEYADVISIEGGRPVTTRGLEYVVGQRVTPDKYDPDIRVECTNGIHFFTTRGEAVVWGG